MFAQLIIMLAIVVMIGWVGYKYLIKPCCGCETPPNGRSQEQKKLDELKSKLIIAKDKVKALSSIEGVEEEMCELQDEIKEHELTIKEIEEDLDE